MADQTIEVVTKAEIKERGDDTLLECTRAQITLPEGATVQQLPSTSQVILRVSRLGL